MKQSIIFKILSVSQRRAGVVFAVAAIVTVVMGWAALKLEIDPDIQALIPQNSRPIKLMEEYGRDLPEEYFIVAVEAREAEALYSLEKLQALGKAIAEIESIEKVHGSINPFNFLTFAGGGTGAVLPAETAPGGTAPETEEELELFRERLTGNPLARNMVLSGDGTALAVIFNCEKLNDYEPLLAEVDSALETLGPHYRTYVAGSSPLIKKVKDYIGGDVPKLMIIGILIMLLVFYLGIRTKRSVFLPFVVVILGTLWTLGTMSLLGLKLTVVSLMVPPLILTLGSSYCIHILSQYYREIDPADGSSTNVAVSVYHVTGTVVLAALTTLIGFGSLFSGTLSQVREFALEICLGIIYCMLLSLLFLPAVLSRLKTPTAKEQRRFLKGNFTALMSKIGAFAARRRIILVAVFAAVVVGFFFSAPHISYKTDYMGFFKKKETAVTDNLYVIEKFGGYLNAYITLTAPENEKGYFLKPDVLETIARFQEEVAAGPDVSYIASFVSYLKLMNKARTGEYVLPASRAPALLLSRYFNTILEEEEGDGSLEQFVNRDFSELTIMVRMFDSDTGSLMYEDTLGDFIGGLTAATDENFGGEMETAIWGPTLVNLYLSENLAKSQIISTAIAVLLILVLTSLVFRSFAYGLLTLIPMVSGIMLNFIIMNLLGISLDIVTVMFTSVTIGVGIDDSIHLLINYRKQVSHPDNLELSGDVLENTLIHAGRPILHTSVALVAGLMVLTASNFLPIVYFGILVSVAIVTTTFSALLVLPAFLSLLRVGRLSVGRLSVGRLRVGRGVE